MALWGVEVKAGEPYVLKVTGGRRIRITQATLGDYAVLGWSTVEARRAAESCNGGGGGGGGGEDGMFMRICALNPIHNPVSSLELEIGEDDGSVIVSVTGVSSVHLSGHYCIIPAAAAAADGGGAEDGRRLRRRRRRPAEQRHQRRIPHTQVEEEQEKKNKKQRTLGDDLGTHNQNRDKVDTHGEDRIHEKDYVSDTSLSQMRGDVAVASGGKTAAISLRSSGAAAAGAAMNEKSEPALTRVKTEAISIRSSGAAAGAAMRDMSQPALSRVKTEADDLVTDQYHCHDRVLTEELTVGPSTADQITSRNATVKVRYAGRLIGSAQIVDPTDGNDVYTFKISASKVIRGWEHILGMRVGGKRRLTIPPSLGFGAEGKEGVIPPNSWLVYEMELLEIVPRGKASKGSSSPQKN